MTSPHITHADASKNVIAFANEGRLIQRIWHRKREGRELACLLGSMHADVSRPSDCSGDLMPLWLAELTPPLFDGIPSSEVKNIGLRYGALIAQWHVFTPEKWETIKVRFLIRCIDEAVEAARPVASGRDYWLKVEAACRQVCDALKSGDVDKLKEAAEAARAAAASRPAWAAAAAAARAAWAAARAAEAARAAAAAWAAEAEAWAAARAAAAAWAAEAEARAAARAAEAARATRQETYLALFTFLLDQIELELKAS